MQLHLSSDFCSQRSTAGAMPASDGIILVEEAPFASSASEGAGVGTLSLEFPFSSQTQVKGQSSPAPTQPSSTPAESEKSPTSQTSSLATTLQPNGSTSAFSGFRADPKAQHFFPDKVNEAPVYITDNGHNLNASGRSAEHATGQQVCSSRKYFAQTGSWARSASLPRGYRRSEGSCRLSSAITPRPFSNKQSKMSSLPRLQHVSAAEITILSKSRV